MWALSCAFLEILMWLCLPGFDQDEFHKERFEANQGVDQSDVTADTYWTKKSVGLGHVTHSLAGIQLGYVRNSAVDSVIQRLKNDQLKGTYILLHLVELIEQMLEVSRRRRLKAGALVLDLQKILKAAEKTMKDSGANYYLDKLASNNAHARGRTSSLQRGHRTRPFRAPSAELREAGGGAKASASAASPLLMHGPVGAEDMTRELEGMQGERPVS